MFQVSSFDDTRCEFGRLVVAKSDHSVSYSVLCVYFVPLGSPGRSQVRFICAQKMYKSALHEAFEACGLKSTDRNTASNDRLTTFIYTAIFRIIIFSSNINLIIIYISNTYIYNYIEL